MQNIRWVNPNHTQTLRIGVFLLYFNAVISLLGGRVGGGLGFLVFLGSLGGAVGISNDRRIGWYVGIAASVVFPLVLLAVLFRDGLSRLFDFDFLILALFPAAQLAALIHPLSREYVKIWFDR